MEQKQNNNLEVPTKMDKIEVLQNEVKVAKKNIDDVFAQVNMAIPTMSLDIQIHFGFDITISVKDDKYNWSGDIVRVNLRQTHNYETEVVDTSKTKLEFSYGSGGWNDFESKETLCVAVAAMQAAHDVIEIAEQNLEFINNSLRVYNKACSDYTIELDRLKKIKNSQIANDLSNLLAPMISTWTPVTKEMVESALYENDHIGNIYLFKLEKYNNKFEIHPIHYQRERTVVYQREKYNTRSTYKKNGDRVSYDSICKEVEVNELFINEFGLDSLKMYQIARQDFSNIEEFRNAIKEVKGE